MAKYFSLLWLLVRSELSRRYSGRLLGPLWAFVLPVLTILVIWVALVYGLRMKELSGGGYSLDLVIGLMAWLFFADALSTSIVALTANPHLVKKVVFPIVLLPLAQTCVSFMIHVCVVIVLCVAFGFFGVLSFSGLPELVFWMVVLWALATGLALLISGFAVIIKDVAEVIPAILQILFWASPIIWPVSTIAEAWKPVLLSNPLAIILQGYRHAMIGTEFGIGTISVALLCAGIALLLVFATIVFSRMKVIFAEEI